jgi:hypothetical protein
VFLGILYGDLCNSVAGEAALGEVAATVENMVKLVAECALHSFSAVLLH